MAKLIKKDGHIIYDEDNLAHYHALVDDGIPYTCTLNQTDVKRNNNKFYIMQILEHDKNTNYIIYCRWGRIGEFGTFTRDTYSNKSTSVSEFNKKFRAKTKNAWATVSKDHSKFQKYDGKYFMAEIDADDDDSDANTTAAAAANPTVADPVIVADPSTVEVKKLESELSERIQDFISLIGDINMFNSTMKEFNIDIKKMPLGKIKKDQIEKGYDVLKTIAEDIKTGDINGQVDRLTKLTNNFYTLIPSTFGRRKPPVINSEDIVKKLADMLDVLADMAIAGTIINEKATDGIHPCDKMYKQIGATMAAIPLDDSSNEYKFIYKYIKNTSGASHFTNLDILDIVSIYRKEEHDRFVDHGNRRLLFHGSRLANYMGILSQGLLLNPNAPVTGKMFGNSLYFACTSTKSANYCYAYSTNGIGVMLLCEVSLGNCCKRTQADFITDIPNEKYQSTWGMGDNTTDPNDFEIIKADDGADVLIPYGKMIDAHKIHKKLYTCLLYDEFCIYDVRQIKIRYAVKLKFN